MSINITNLKKNYGRLAVLDGVTFSANEGEIVCITGRNGCGKTTLLSILAGVEKPDSGTISTEPSGAIIGYLPQINPLLNKLSVKDNLKLWCRNQSEFEEVCDKFELHDMLKKPVSILSGGMKRRLSLACAMAGSPAVLIMDEPTAALDIEYKKLIHDMMRTFADDGGIIIMVSHEAEEIQMSNVTFTLADGKLS